MTGFRSVLPLFNLEFWSKGILTLCYYPPQPNWVSSQLQKFWQFLNEQTPSFKSIPRAASLVEHLSNVVNLGIIKLIWNLPCSSSYWPKEFELYPVYFNFLITKNGQVAFMKRIPRFWLKLRFSLFARVNAKWDILSDFYTLCLGTHCGILKPKSWRGVDNKVKNRGKDICRATDQWCFIRKVIAARSESSQAKEEEATILNRINKKTLELFIGVNFVGYVQQG